MALFTLEALYGMEMGVYRMLLTECFRVLCPSTVSIDLHGQLCHQMISLARNVFRSLSIMFDYKSKMLKTYPIQLQLSQQ